MRCSLICRISSYAENQRHVTGIVLPNSLLRQPVVAGLLPDIFACICRCWNAPGYRFLVFFVTVGLLADVSACLYPPAVLMLLLVAAAA
ncbi:hypothetical protein TNCV_1855561 [Trichonephila clavipes]|nr:hypothetical protein TNCV_1855561 [Trichonephila clavipes]